MSTAVRPKEPLLLWTIVIGLGVLCYFTEPPAADADTSVEVR